MASSRRRFLFGSAAAAVAALAGCSGDSPSSIEETVTPAPVPRTNRERLQEARTIESPSIPSPVVVTDDHRDAAVEQLERTVERLDEVLAEEEEIDPTGIRLGVGADGPDDVIERAEARLTDARQNGPSIDTLDSVENGIREVATYLGFLQARRGTVGPEVLLEEIAAERSAVSELRGQITYRVAEPLEAYLPTLATAEEVLEGLDLGVAVERLEAVDTDDEEFPAEFGRARGAVERHRRRRDDVERYLAVATDPDAPSRQAAIDAELDDLQAEIAALLAERDGDEPTRGDTSIAGEFRRIRETTALGGQRWDSELEEYRETGRRLLGLLEALEWRIEFRSIESGVERTLDRVDEGEFRAEGIAGEKRRAVEAMERAADADALSRRLTESSEVVLAAVDRQTLGPADAAAFAFFVYVVAAEWADRGMRAADELAGSLRGRE